MLRRPVLSLLAALISVSAHPEAQTASVPGPGVPLELAEERSARISDLQYDLRFSIPERLEEPVTGEATITFDLRDAGRPLALDFAAPEGSVTAATVNGSSAGLGYTVDHLVIPAAHLRSGRNELRLQFRSGDAPLNRQQEFMYALFVPARARQAFPCFDQPDLKARYRVSLEIPGGWEAITNGAEESRRTAGSRVSIAFAETRPIPTYLFTFAAGKFQVETSTQGGRSFRMLHRETDAAKVARNRDAIFELHGAALGWLEQYTGIAYPFGKFDFLLVPSFQFGGMEHPGAVYYNASGLLLDPSATQNQKLGRASLIAHETAHMWFGDLVTMRWFNDVWMKEVFANFMAAKVVNPAFPEINHPLRFLYAHYPAAYGVDRTQGSNPIRQPLANLLEAGSLYGAIIYQKAPIVMRQLEVMLGADVLRDGLRRYLKDHAFGNAAWTDLISILDPLTPEDLHAWSRAWVEEEGRPEVTTELTITGDRIERLGFRQRHPAAGRKASWTQRAAVTLNYGGKMETLPVSLSGEYTEVTAARGRPAPSFVLPTGEGLAYGGFALDAKSRAWLGAHLEEVRDPLTRGAALVTLWEEMLEGRIRPDAMLDVVLRALGTEDDELTVERMLGYAQQVYWKFLSVDERRAAATRMEHALRAGLHAARTQSLKAAWFNALRDTATTRATLTWLEGVWRQSEPVPGLVLAEPDYISLAQELALRGVPAADAIVEAQIERTQNPDRKARMIFVRPALSGDPAVRDRFFESLRAVESRRREAWVLEALGYLHHPLRAQRAERYVRPSLELLREIQQTGDIFFPKRWMDATLSGHRTRAVAQAVRAFLAELPRDYPDRLRRIIVASADDLFRAAAVSR